MELALTGAKAKNHVAAKALLADFLSRAELDEAGTVKGLAEEMKKLTTGKDTAFLFDTTPTELRGTRLGGTGGKVSVKTSSVTATPCHLPQKERL